MVITEEFVCVIFEIVSLGIFLRRFTVSSYQRALYWQRINDGYFTMSDGMLNGIFLIVHRTFLLSCFRGCWLLDFSCAQSMWTYNEAAIELAAAVFGKRLQEHQAMSFVTKLNSWRRKHYKIRLDSFLYLSGFTAKINTTVCSSRLFSTDLERHLSTS